MLQVIETILTKWPYFAGEDAPIQSLWVHGDCPLFLVLGENAAGKSFFRRCLHQEGLKRPGIKELVHLSMQSRSSHTMYGLARTMIYGDEDQHSTGENSAATVRGAIRTCTGREHDHILYWDEPDIGMSDGAAAGCGIVIAEFVGSLPEHTKGVFLTTHNRALVERLLPLRPHYIHLGHSPGGAPSSLEAWLQRPVVPVLPEELLKMSNTRMRAIEAVLRERQKAWAAS